MSEVVDKQKDTVNYAPTFTFKAIDGRDYSVTSDVASNPPSFEVGEEVRIVYIKSNPGSAKIDSFWQLWLVETVLGFLGIFFAGAGYLLLRYEKRSLLPRDQFISAP